ncbi:hypothetical protein DFS34DRAFT_75258 [Phlyctochytrium arcticum]|nr:hypothetical protein DFS34DRAFT_75258 [Phlyctochytrium arcticum]
MANNDYDSQEEYEEDDDESVCSNEGREALTKPDTYALQYRMLHEHVKRRTIDLDAPYQRDIVWTAVKQGHLIDSLIKNYYVPPVIFSIRHDKSDPNAQPVRVAIDGKQRLTSIHRFIQGEIPYLDTAINKRIWYKNPKKERGRSPAGLVMTDGERKEFDSKKLVCVDYKNLTIEQELEIFRRVQLGVSLTPAEKLFARQGPYAEFARHLLEQFSDLCSIVESKRKTMFQLMLQIIVVVVDKPAKLPLIPSLETLLNKTEPLSVRDSALVESVLQLFMSLKVQCPDVITKPARMLGIEFLMICYLISLKQDAIVQEIRTDVALLRKKSRKKFPILRVTRAIYVYMKGLCDDIA